MSDSTFVLPYSTPLDLTGLRSAARLAGQAAAWLGGGLLFALTVYLVVALPGLFD